MGSLRASVERGPVDLREQINDQKGQLSKLDACLQKLMDRNSLSLLSAPKSKRFFAIAMPIACPRNRSDFRDKRKLRSDSVKRHLRGRHLSVLNLKFDFISDGGCTREEQIALSLKRHLFPHGGREPKAF